MATGATRLNVAEPQQPASSGNALLVVVGIATIFLSALALLSMKGSPLFTEGNMLYFALIFFAASSALYIGFGVSGNERFVRFGSFANIAAFLFTSAAAGHRWSVAGHPPFASIYEMLLSFVWTVSLLTLFAEKRFNVKLIGSVTMPLSVVSVTLMQLLPSEVRPLVPALQSTWLHIHVTLAMLSYAACALSFATAMMFLIKDNLESETFLAFTSAFSTVIYGSILGTRLTANGGLDVVSWNLETKSEAFVTDGVRMFVTIPELGWFFVLATLAVAAPLVLYALGKLQRNERLIGIANTATVIGIGVQVLALGAFFMRARGGLYPVAAQSIDAATAAGGVIQVAAFTTTLSASPFILSGIMTGIFGSILYLMLHWRRTGLENLLPSTDTLDRVTYRTICIAFPLLTLMIAAGAYWANRAWGSYWQWDPKETWALITWLVYAGYLHMRLTRGWRGRKAAYFSIAGFAFVMFTFFGVTYLLPGLHAYA